MNFPPTTQQQAIIDAFATGEDMVIEAGAGTGKTSTLEMMADSTDRKGIYIAYNRAIKDDAAARFPSNVMCKTAHGLAYGSTVARNPWMKARLKAQRLPSRQQVAVLGIPAGGFNVNDNLHVEAWMVARLASQTVDRFCYSADESLSERHVPHTENIDNDDHWTLAKFVLPFALKVWADMNDPKGMLPLKHDAYLKMWGLTHPKLRADFVMLDEAQDANPIIAQIVGEQNCQKIMVGDRCQAIYGWRGALDAMSTFEAKHHLILSQSFRFGEAVAAEANKWLNLLDAPLRLEGFDKIKSEVVALSDQDADVILCRTNAGVIATALEAQQQGRKVAIVGGTKEIKAFAFGARELKAEGKSSHPDLIAFESWDEVTEYAENEGTDLKVMVKMINTYGVSAVLAVCANSVDEKTADLIISTAHKAKGREWNRVRISNDFREPEDGKLPSNAEMMLLYVAVTRAKLALDALALDWVNSLS